MRDGVAGRHEVAAQVHPHDRVPLVDRHVGQHAVAQEPGVAHDGVEPTERIDRLAHHGAHLIPVGDVGAIGDGFAALRLDLGDDLLRRRRAGRGAVALDAEIVDHDPRALGRERERVRAPEPAPGTGDDDHATVTTTHAAPRCRRLLERRLEVRADDPHREVLRGAAVGVADGHLGAVDLVVARGAPHLIGRLEAADETRRADRDWTTSTPPDMLTGNAPPISVSPRSVTFQPSPSSTMRWPSSHIGSYHENGTYSSAQSTCLSGLVMPAFL